MSYLDYQIYINQTPIAAGSVIVVLAIILILFAILIITTSILRRKLKEDETLKYEFITIIAHKFRTPLSQIKWLLETMAESEQDPYKKESIANLQQANQKLIGLTNTLVELTDSANKSISSYNFEKINIFDLATQVINTLKVEFHEKNLFFGIECSDPEIYAKIDKSRMEFVLQTLLENAINYSPTGRNVDIKITRDKRKAFIQVIDNGIGIDPAEISRVFSKFFRTQRARAMDTEGFGVGLFLAQSIVNHHNGKIEIYSEGLNKGTALTVTLPLA